MYSIDSTNKKIIFTFGRSTIFEELKMISAMKAQQIITKEGTDFSDMYIITDDQASYMDHWLGTTLPLITATIPQQHLTTSMSSTNIIVTAYTDTTRALSEGNIATADGILRNLLIYGCLTEWYASVAQTEFQQEYGTKLAENIRLFSETLWDSRKRKVGTLFSTITGDGRQAASYADQITALQTLVAALQVLTAAQGTTIAGHTTDIAENASDIDNLEDSTGTLTTNLANEISRAQGAESGILSTVQGWLSDFASLKIKVNNVQKVNYAPSGEDQTVNISVPTSVSDLSDGSSYSTTTAVGALIAAAIQTFAGSSSTLATILSDYATKAWVTANFSGGGGTTGAYVDLVSNQTIAGVKTFGDIVATGTIALPSRAPVNATSGLNYIWVDTEGNYSVEPDDD